MDWTDRYSALAFPGSVGGGPAAGDTLALTVTATGATSANPVKAAADMKAFHALEAAGDADAERHERFSDIVLFFRRYGQPVVIESNGNNVITLRFEQNGFWSASQNGRPAWINKIDAATAAEVAAEYVAENDHNVTAIAVTVNGA
jgi:hypothetical protein